MWFISMMILKNIDVKNLEILLVVSQRKFIELYHSIFASEIIVNLGIIEPENITKIVEKYNLSNEEKKIIEEYKKAEDILVNKTTYIQTFKKKIKEHLNLVQFNKATPQQQKLIIR
jgi:hypothetical protein